MQRVGGGTAQPDGVRRLRRAALGLVAVARRAGMTYEGTTERYYGKALELFSVRPSRREATGE